MTNELFQKIAEVLTNALGRTPTKAEVIGSVCATLAKSGVDAKTIIDGLLGKGAYETFAGEIYDTLRAG